MATRQEQLAFSIMIDELVKEHKLTHMEAVLYYCEETGFDVELAGTLVSGALKEKVRLNGEDLNLLPKTAMLSFD